MRNNFDHDNELIKALCGQREEEVNMAIAWLLKNEKLKRGTQKMVFEYGGSREDAEDVFAEGINSLIKNIVLRRFNEKSMLSTYLYSICRNIYLSKYRQNPLTLPLKEAGHQTDSNSNIENKIIANEQKKIQEEVFNQFLERLNEKCKKVLEMQKKGVSMADIAIEMDWKTSQAAKNYTFKCRKKMRELFLNDDDILKILNKKA